MIASLFATRGFKRESYGAAIKLNTVHARIQMHIEILTEIRRENGGILYPDADYGT